MACPFEETDPVDEGGGLEETILSRRGYPMPSRGMRLSGLGGEGMRGCEIIIAPW
jgi:hypothetical protein